MRFNKITDKEIKKIVAGFVNDLQLDLNLPESVLDSKQKIYIAQKLIEYYSGSARFTSELKKVHEEIITNYKKYLPLCYASIRTAIKNING